MSFKNTKYLLYRFNDLQNSIGELLIKVKHSVVTDNYIATEEIQNQNWQYFIERVLEVCHSKEVGSTIKPTEDFLLTIVKKMLPSQKDLMKLFIMSLSVIFIQQCQKYLMMNANNCKKIF